MNFIIVVGCQRSGTTLVGQIIGSHPEAVLIDENDGLYAWTDALFNNNSGRCANELFNECCLRARRKYLDPNSRFTDNGGLLRAIKYVVLKAPNLTFSFSEISENLPTAKVVYLYRDIRDVVASMTRLKNVPILTNQTKRILSSPHIIGMFPEEVDYLVSNRDEQNNHVKMAVMAKIKMSLAEEFQNRGVRVVKLRYEDLVKSGPVIIPAVLSKLEIKNASDCLNYPRILRGMGPGKTDRNRKLDPASLNKWQKTLTNKQASEVWDKVEKFMQDLGYLE